MLFADHRRRNARHCGSSLGHEQEMGCIYVRMVDPDHDDQTLMSFEPSSALYRGDHGFSQPY